MARHKHDARAARFVGRRRAMIPRNRCPRFPKKHQYVSLIGAMQQADRNRRRGRGDVYYYQCDARKGGCGWFHLSSQNPETIGMTWTGDPT
jgi:hypothetical protein